MSPQELVTTLISQHTTLKSDLASVMDGLQSISSNTGQNSVLGLAKFKADVLIHLDLENGTFYPDYLAKKAKIGEEIETTKEFINQMIEIGKAVMAFLDKYNTPESIDKDVANFKKELTTIIGVLKTRIETEEEGVYDIYLLL